MSATSVRRIAAAVLLLCMLVPARASAASTSETQIVRALNAERVSRGLPRLRTDRGLARAAVSHSRSMARVNTMEHGDTDRRVRRYVRSRTVGENLAWMEEGCDAAVIVAMWLDSPPHRKVMLSKAFKLVGVGRSGSGGCYVTADFASAK